MFKLEIDKEVVKKDLGNIVERCFRVHGVNICAQVLDNIKAMGYKYSTRGAITVAVSDIIVPPEKPELLRKADEQRARYRAQVPPRPDERGRALRQRNQDLERHHSRPARAACWKSWPHTNPIYMMTNSGARGSIAQVAQLAGMRGN